MKLGRDTIQEQRQRPRSPAIRRPVDRPTMTAPINGRFGILADLPPVRRAWLAVFAIVVYAIAIALGIGAYWLIIAVGEALGIVP